MRLVISLCLYLAVIPAVMASDTKESAKGLSHYIAGVYYEDVGELKKASSEYRKALEEDPDSALLHLNLASICIKDNDAAQAEAQLKQAIDLAPDSVEPHAILALVYTAQNKTELAAGEYTVALKNAARLEPKNIEIYKSLGAIYLQQKKLKEAEGVFKLIQGLDRDDLESHFYLASIYYDLKNFPAAEKELKAALKINPGYHEALNFLGYFYLEQDRNINQAGRLIQKALVSEPENAAYIDSLGWFYFKKGKYKDALEKLEKAASLMSDPVIYDHLGDVYLKLGNRGDAGINWKKSLNLDSAQEKVKEKLLKLDGK